MMRTRLSNKRPSGSLRGFSLVELLVALALMGMVSLSITFFLVKGSASSSSIGTRFKEAAEVQALVTDLMQDLSKGAYISPNSHKQRLEYTTYDSAGNASKKIYRIISASGSNYLQLSTDSATTWGSPYRISGYTKYQLTGTPLFLYSHDANNCTSFTDTNGNGVWQTGVDAAGVTAACGSHSISSPVLTSPSQATKVVLSGFVFSSGTGNPVVTRSLPSNIFMASPHGLVVSTSSVADGVKDSPVLTSFDVATANSLFGTYFDVRGLTWDPIRARLLMVGHHGSGGPAKIYQVERNGVPINGLGLVIQNPAVQLGGIALLEDGQTVIALDDSAKKVYWYNLNGSSLLVPFQTFNLANPSTGSPALAGSSNLVNSPTSIAYDPNTPNDFYVVGTDPAGSTFKIFAIDSTTGSLSTASLASGALALPAAFDASHPPGGLAIEPVTGDFLVIRNYVSGSSPNKLVTIYRITRTGTSTSFDVNVDDIGSTATGTSGYWGLGYSPNSNHIFLSDTVTDKVYEVYPSVLISPRS